MDFSDKYDITLYDYSENNIKFSEVIEDTSGYKTHKIFTKETWFDNYSTYSWYLFNEDDKIISFSTITCEDNPKDLKHFLKKEDLKFED